MKDFKANNRKAQKALTEALKKLGNMPKQQPTKAA